MQRQDRPKCSYSQIVNAFIIECIKPTVFKNYRLIAVTDLQKEFYKLEKQSDQNLWRKQYGNLDQALKALKIPLYFIDGTCVKLKKKEEVEQIIKDSNFNIEPF